MRRLSLILAIVAAACGGSAATSTSSETGGATSGGAEPGGSGEPAGAGGSGEARPANEFQLADSDTAGQARGERPSQIQATETEAAMRLFVVDPENAPIAGIVIKMTAPDGRAFYTAETDSQGYAEVLVPNGQRYAMEYLSLGRPMMTAQVPVAASPNLDVRLTLRYRRPRAAPAPVGAPPPAADARERFVLEGIEFDSARATIRPESHARLDRVVEYLTHRPSARLRIAGYTDNVGNARSNQVLSEQRAQAVRTYLVEHGIDAGRLEAVGLGAENPIASNDTDAGRQQNRRIEATEL